MLSPEGKVLIDPLPLTDAALAEMGKVAAICLTQGHHQRSAWRYRKLFGAPVYAPAGAGNLDEQPDQWYGADDRLPGPLRAIQTTGLSNGFALLVEPEGGSGALFCGDLITRDEAGPYRFPVQPGFIDPVKVRVGARELADLQADSLGPAHGAPCVTGCGAAIQGALKNEGKNQKGS